MHPAQLTRRIPALAIVMVMLASIVAVVTQFQTPASAAGNHGDSLVPQVARADTPRVVDGSVMDIAQVGDRVVVVGDFTKVEQNGVTYDQPFIAAYFLDSGDLDTNFRPTIDNQVRAVETSEDGNAIFIGGRFNTVDGQNYRKLAKLTAGGSLITGFKANATNKVESIAVGGGRVYVGGNFKTIRGQNRAHLAAVNASTGAVDTGFDLPLTGPVGLAGEIDVKALEVSSDGARLLVVHTARFIDGDLRTGVAQINLADDSLSPWQTLHYENTLIANGGKVWITDGAYSPDGTYFVTVASGGDRPPTNDSAVKFPSAGGAGVVPEWVSRHFDSMYAVDISETAVYVGGHFQYQEAPGSTNPFPGDPDVSYGFGVGLGPAVLGDEVVAREQLGALNPATGKSLDWDPGASGFHGVEALTVVPRGLLVGHDGNRIGGVNVGRTGFLDFDTDLLVDGNPETFISSPRPGRVYTAEEPVQFAGSAVGTPAIDRVQLEVQNIDTKQWLRRDGSMGSYQLNYAELADAPFGATAWSLAATLPDGEYRLQARAVDTSARKDDTKAVIRFTVLAGDTVAPETSISEPRNGTQDFASNTFTITGAASDDFSVDSVRVQFYDLDKQLWLRTDGTLGGFDSFAAVVANPGAGETAWSLEITVPSGRWRVTAVATDGAGVKDPSVARATYYVFPGNAAPSATLDAPLDKEIFAAGPITISGTAGDDAGVRKVRVLMRALNTLQGPQPNGFVGYANWVDVQVDQKGATNTTWSYTTPDLPPGYYKIQVAAVDTANVTTAGADRPFVFATLTVPGDAEPQTDITSQPVSRQDFPDTIVDISGVATDDNGVSRVAVQVYSYTERLWLASDLTWDRTFGEIDATVASPGATTTDFSLVLDLPEGSYRVFAYAVDTAGQYDLTNTDSRGFYKVFPGDADPDTQLNSPIANAVLPAGGIAVGGRVFDAESVAKVQVWVRNKATLQGPRQDGSIGNPQWVDGFLTNPGGTFSDFSHLTPNLPPGEYLVYVRAVDSLGKVDLDYERISVTLS